MVSTRLWHLVQLWKNFYSDIRVHTTKAYGAFFTSAVYNGKVVSVKFWPLCVWENNIRFLLNRMPAPAGDRTTIPL